MRDLLPPGPVLGIDIGGTKLAAGVVDRRGRVLSSLRAPTSGDLDAEGLLASVVALAERARRESPRAPVAVGVGCGGPMDFRGGVVSPLHLPAWRDFPLRARLEAALGLPAVLDNDAKAFALGEAHYGAGRGARCLLLDQGVQRVGVAGRAGVERSARQAHRAGLPYAGPAE